MIRVVLLFLLCAMAVEAAPHIIPLHAPGRVPEVVQDRRGVLHLTYGKENDGYYVQSRDGGKTFSPAIKVNQRAGTVTVGGERGVKIALGKDGIIHLVWLGHYQKGGGILYTRSTDGGKTFESERNLQDTEVGSDSPAIVADANGNLLVFWLDARIGKEEDNPVAHPILMTRSTDNGTSFSRNEIVKYDFAGRACACCRLEARLQGDDLYIAFRTGYHNIRDFYLLKGRKLENNFKAVQVSADDWKLEGCPMSGADFRVEKNGQVLISWMSQGKVYWSHSRGAGFVPRIQLPANEGTANHPMIVANRNRDVLLVWKQNTELRWARYAIDGKFTGEQGSVGAMPSKDKAVAIVGRDDKFYVVVAAQ
ncbi:MAG: hypothetical protein JST84_19670 [Acidobacteria bacterium]|nr:hypothetical protein [Acidobacteriota bacterium]